MQATATVAAPLSLKPSEQADAMQQTVTFDAYLLRCRPVEVVEDRLAVTPRGRLLLRTVAMVFDACISRPGDTGLQYSRVL